MSEHRFRVGVVGPFTGPRSDWGSTLQGAVVASQPRFPPHVEWILQDDEGDPQTAERCARRLVEAGVDAVVGHLNSFGALRALPHYRKASIPVLLPASTLPGLTAGAPNLVLRLCATDTTQVTCMLDAVRWHGFREITVVNDLTDYGRALAARVLDAAPAALSCAVVPAAAVASGASLAGPVVFTGALAEAVALCRLLRARGRRDLVLASDDSHHPAFVLEGGEAVDGVRVVGQGESPGETMTAALSLVADALETAPHARGHELLLRMRCAPGAARFDEAGEREDAGWAVYRVAGGRFHREEGG